MGVSLTMTKRDGTKAKHALRDNPARRLVALHAIADFPITDPTNQDAVNMQIIAQRALALPSNES